MKQEGITIISEHALLQKQKQIMTQINSLETDLHLLPEGKLLIVKNGKYTKWKLSQNGKITHIPKAKKEYAEQLALRRIKNCQLLDLKQELHYLEQILQAQHHLKNRTSTLISHSPDLAKLITNHQIDQYKAIKNWTSQEYASLAPYQEKRIHKSASGLLVRSKSEALIVSRLLAFQIPFLYEFPLHLDTITLYPDFTLLHPLTMAISYYEHLGLMDNPDYASKSCRKINTYIENGITPANKLYLTYEDRRHPLAIEDIDNILMKFLRS